MTTAQPANKSTKQVRELEDSKRATLHLLKDLDEERVLLIIAKAKEDALLASIGDGVMAVDNEEKIILVNRVAETMLGYKAKEILGKKMCNILLIKDEQDKKLSEKKWPIHICLTEGKTITTSSYFYQIKKGTKIPVAITATPIMLDKKIIGSVNVFRDITKEKELDQAKDEFIALASHQLNSPITAVIWGIQALLSGGMGRLNSEQKETMEKILQRSRNMAALVGGFLDATKLEASDFKTEKGDADLVKISNSLLEELASQIIDKKITIVRKYSNRAVHLGIGEKTARIIIQNLLVNAIKYTPPKGIVEITIEKAAKGASIIVKDNGYGIPKAAQSRIFTKLFRADNIKEKEPLGTGLGLYLLKSLVDKLGGKVWFESKEGEGSIFYVELK